MIGAQRADKWERRDSEIMRDMTDTGDVSPPLDDGAKAIPSGTLTGVGLGSGPVRIFDLLILTALLAPAALAVELWGWNGLGGAAALAWLFPVAQLVHARLSVGSCQSFVRGYLLGDGSRSNPCRLIY